MFNFYNCNQYTFSVTVLVNKLSTRYLEIYVMSLVELVAQDSFETYIGECTVVHVDVYITANLLFHVYYFTALY